jgi:hypothetical protein
MNFMPPNSAQTSIASTTPIPIPAQNGISFSKKMALFFVSILSMLGTLAWVAFLIRVAWSIF